MTPRLDSSTLQDGDPRLPDIINDSLIRYLEVIAENVRDTRFLLHGASRMLHDIQFRSPAADDYRDALNLRLHTMRSNLDALNEQAQERLSLIVEQMKVSEGVTEELKAADQMAWVRAMNSIRNRAEEIVLNEIVYR